MHTPADQSRFLHNFYRRLRYHNTKPAPAITRICAGGPLSGEPLTLTVGCRGVGAASAVFVLRGHIGRYIEGRGFDGKPAFVWEPQPTGGNT